MIWRVLGVAAISLWGSFSWRGGILDWLMPLLIPIITIMMLLPPCIINCLTRFFSSQVNKLQHAVPVQQRYIKLYPIMENITHPQMGTTIRSLRLETSKRGRPDDPHCPSSIRTSQRGLNVLIAKELGLLSLKGGMLGSQNRKKDTKVAVAKIQGREKTNKQTNKTQKWNKRKFTD